MLDQLRRPSRRGGATAPAGSSCSPCSPRSSAAAPGGTCSGPGAYTTVPTIIGQNEAEATAILERAGLGADPSSAFDGEAPVGEVFATDPGQGDRIRKDGTVAFTVSKGPDYVAVPDGVVGAEQADAEAALVAAGLTAAYAEPEYSDTVTEHPIISATLPDGTPAEPGAQTIRGTEVRLTVSKGPEPVTITSVVGTTARGRDRSAASPTTSSSRRPRSSATPSPPA